MRLNATFKKFILFSLYIIPRPPPPPRPPRPPPPIGFDPGGRGKKRANGKSFIGSTNSYKTNKYINNNIKINLSTFSFVLNEPGFIFSKSVTENH
jgi:hypothetical protein